MFICDVLERNAERIPHKTAIVCGGRQYSFAQLKARTDRLSALLTALGVRAGDRVGVLLPNCAEYAESFLAPLRIAAVAVPLNPACPFPDLEGILKDCKLSALIMSDETFEEIREIIRKFPHMENLILNYRYGPLFVPARRTEGFRPMFCKGDYGGLPASDTARNILQDAVEENDEAVYIYTSGTTGEPKGVILTHGIIARRGDNSRNLEMCAEDRCYTLGGLYHNGKLFIGLIRSLYLGMSFYTDPEFHPLRTLDCLQYEQISYFHASPFHFGILAFWDGLKDIPRLPCLRICLSSGNHMDPEIKAAFQKRFGIPIRENYGITETGGLCTDGLPHPGVKIRIRDVSGKELGENQAGEIVVSGPEMSGGYRNRPELTESLFRGGYYHTGDTGMLDGQGKLHIFSRKNNRMSPAPWQEAIRKNRFDLFRP